MARLDNFCKWLPGRPPGEGSTISAYTNWLYEWYTAPARVALDAMSYKELRFLEIGCDHEFGFGAVAFSTIAWLTLLFLILLALVQNTSNQHHAPRK